MTMADATSEVHEASDGRRWTLRRARPTDARALVRLFGSVREEGRWLATPPSAVSEPSESYFVGEMIRSGETLVLVADADGDVVGNVLVSVEQSSLSDHIGVLSIAIRDGWRDVGIGSAMIRAAQAWTREQGLAKLALGVFPDNERAVAVYEHAGFQREGVRRRQYRAPGGFRDELLMAWFPDEEPGA